MQILNLTKLRGKKMRNISLVPIYTPTYKYPMHLVSLVSPAFYQHSCKKKTNITLFGKKYPLVVLPDLLSNFLWCREEQLFFHPSFVPLFH